MAVVNEKKVQTVTTSQPVAKATQKIQPVSAGKVTDGKQQGFKKINPYAGLTGVSANTAQQIASAQQGYNSPYSGMINSILQQITNPQEFKYEFNQDNLFKAYQDLYTQQGRQASLDAQGQAAGLTGGYGNSYGAAVGNQAYQQWLTRLYDKGLEFYDRARQRYNDDWNQLLGQYDVLNGQDQQGYQQWLNNLNYWTGLGQTENQGYMNDQQLAIQQAQLQIQQEQWAAEQAAMQAAAAAEASGGGGGGGGGGDKPVAYNYNGHYYVLQNGQMVEIPKEQAQNYMINTSYQDAYNAVAGNNGAVTGNAAIGSGTSGGLNQPHVNVGTAAAQTGSSAGSKIDSNSVLNWINKKKK